MKERIESLRRRLMDLNSKNTWGGDSNIEYDLADLMSDVLFLMERVAILEQMQGKEGEK